MPEKSRSALNRFFKVTAVMAALFSAYEVVSQPLESCSCVTQLQVPCCPAHPSWYYPLLIGGIIVLIVSLIGILATRRVERVNTEKKSELGDANQQSPS
jgi:hypothetical protein